MFRSLLFASAIAAIGATNLDFVANREHYEKGRKYTIYFTKDFFYPLFSSFQSITSFENCNSFLFSPL